MAIAPTDILTREGLAVWCIVLNTGRVANSLRFCDVFKRKL